MDLYTGTQRNEQQQQFDQQRQKFVTFKCNKEANLDANIIFRYKFTSDQQIEICNDNLQTIRLLKKEEPIIKTILKYVDINQHWLREKFQRNQVKVLRVNTNNMAADGITKPLSRQKYTKFVNLLNLVSIPEKQDSTKH